MRLEIGLRRFGARLLHRRRPGAVAGKSEIGGIEARNDGGGESALSATLGEAEEDPRALAEARDEPRFGHQLQMTADAGLALAENLGEVLDVQLSSGEQRENAQARGLAGSTKRGQRMGSGKAWDCGSCVGIA